MLNKRISLIALGMLSATPVMANDQAESKGFVEDSSLKVLLRNAYINRDYKNGNDDKAEWGQAAIGTFSSGFTQGTVGVGVDVIGQYAIRLDGGQGRAGAGGIDFFKQGDSGAAANDLSKGGAAVKFRLSDTTLKYGRQFVASPVFATDDSRLLPEVAEGTYISSKEIKGLEVNLGRFTALSSQTGMGKDSINGAHTPGLTSANIGGATYQFTDNFVAGFAASDVDDYFKKQYINANYTLPINDEQSLNFDLNAYKTKDQGAALYGPLDNKLWSLAAAYSLGAHKFTLGYQQSSGDTNYLYGVDGNGTIFVANSIQISDFIGQEEKSYQARYDLNMATYGVPGLSFMSRYVYGNNIETTSGSEGKEHEFNFETKYVFQEGPAKDLSLRLRSAIYRANNAYNADYTADNNDVRIIVEYPLHIL